MSRPVDFEYKMHFGYGKDYPEELKYITKDGKHHGNDYLTPVGSCIYGSVDSIFSEQAWGEKEGLYFVLKFWKREFLINQLYRFLGFHLSRTFTVRMKPGDKVGKNQVIALSGETGSAKGHPHFHGEVQKFVNGLWVPVNPVFIFGES